MTAKKPIRKLHAGFSLVLIAILLCSACVTKIIRGASPLVRVTELSHQDNIINMQVNIRNLNGEDLDIQSIDIRLTVNEDAEELLAYSGPLNENIVANGTEPWSVEVEESESGRKLLESLQSGEIKSLPYKLKGSITSTADGSLRFEYEGHMYPAPGKPGHFR